MHKARILIVEDESIVAQDIRFSLEDRGYEVVGVFAEGAEAFARIDKLKPELVLMDIRIEGPVDGIELAAKLWDVHRLPVIFLTAHSDTATLERAKATRPFGYLLKPFAERELYVAVEIALSKRPQAPVFELPASALYGPCQQMLSAQAFPAGGDSPSADLGAKRWLRAAPGVTTDDATADVLDIVLALWLQQAEDTGTQVSIQADDCLKLRGLQQQKSGTGQRGGYEDKWRRGIAEQLERLASLELGSATESMPLVSLQPQAPYQWLVCPSRWLTEAYFSSGSRATVELSQSILAYDPYRQKWEKRIGRLLCWEDITEVRVGDLLEQLHLPIDGKNPQRTRERLETALNTLRSDGLIEDWEFPGSDLASLSKRGWLEIWLSWRLSIRQRVPRTSSRAPLTSSSRQGSFGFLRYIRAERGLSQAEVAAAIGLTQSQLSQIEAGGRVQPATAAKIKAWLLEAL